MDPLRSGSPSQHYTASVNSAHPPEASGSQAQPVHPGSISPSQLSHNAQQALDQVATQPNLDHQRVASLVRNALQDGSFRLQSTSRMEATYQASVNSPVGARPMSIANLTSPVLTIQTRLNDQSQYHIVSANLRDLSGVISIDLSAPPPASAHGQASSVLSGQQPSISSHQAAQSSRGQLAQATIGHNNSRNSSPLLPSGASVSTRGMVLSNDGSAGASTGVPGHSRNRPAHAARSTPYQAPSLSSRSGATSEGPPAKTASRHGCSDQRAPAQRRRVVQNS